ncbi:SDR family oxidoreductase [Xanthomonas campestris pv. merremiae]|uniref:oxidoreductase n=1 Tax=Xanthomonas citri TaxID=346 RepID=UPI000B5C2EF9|nr:oxidoreductase [Xanthomonas citri]ASK95105.1 short chain dehydrogenase [Xanthomonas citri pv. vignicola]MBV6836812.1 SDR family oxidoreductase [Xanthomonas campestris pv. merremiae]MBZ3931007.1 short-chain dehydrogenase [Xanthomonas campestris pv. merremiae]MCC8566615.1 SDR family oxidoreductase [Xanthomonas citri pv. fuscans]
MNGWTLADLPSQRGRVAIVTGASPGGLGYETALALAGAGAHVVLTARNPDKGEAARRALLARHPEAEVCVEALDLARLASVRAFAKRLATRHAAVDLLINNAGVMAPPQRQTTADGMELQLGSNYLGHFALTAQVLPLLRAASAPRVVNLSSLAHRQARIDFDDLQSERSYRPWKAYGQSKLAMLMFSLELQRRSNTHGWGVRAIAAHPGIAQTALIANGPDGAGRRSASGVATGLFTRCIGHSASAGALPTLYAATSPQAQAGGYYGPNGLFELKGDPAPAKIAHQAHDQQGAARLWDTACALTGVAF